jgi:hypothetical protein
MENTLLINESHSWTNKKEKSTHKNYDNVFGKKLGLMAKLFGCWHRNISRPFAQESVAYRSCLDCGARKRFNPETLRTHGDFYFPPVIR